MMALSILVGSSGAVAAWWAAAGSEVSDTRCRSCRRCCWARLSTAPLSSSSSRSMNRAINKELTAKRRETGDSRRDTAESRELSR